MLLDVNSMLGTKYRVGVALDNTFINWTQTAQYECDSLSDLGARMLSEQSSFYGPFEAS